MARRRVRVRAIPRVRAPDGSAFFKWESFLKGQDMENYDIELDRIGFEKWKNMSKEEKQPFVSHARELDNKHQEALKQDADGFIEIKYGADSPLVEILEVIKTQMIFKESSEDNSKE